jgi:short-subunit dehydrogenase
VAAVPADVGKPIDVKRIGDTAIEQFGHIDTWINNAGVSIYGRNEDIALDDQQRLFQTNFWGVVHGSLEAVRHMKTRGGGALINVGSEASDVAVPLQGIYSASKHAVKGFTDSLRIELEKEKAPISLTLIKPAGIDTMFPVHAKNYMEMEPDLMKPVYAPELVARAILYAAQHPKRDVFVGAAAKLTAASAYYVPRLVDRFLRATAFRQQKTDEPRPRSRSDALHHPDPNTELRERLGLMEKVSERCAYTELSLRNRPWIAPVLLGGGALFAAWRLTRPALARTDLSRRGTG